VCDAGVCVLYWGACLLLPTISHQLWWQRLSLLPEPVTLLTVLLLSE
jgi:hypothetical protein